MLTTVVVSEDAPPGRVQQLSKAVSVWKAPTRQGKLDLVWLLEKLGAEEVTSLLVEGGGEANASFLSQKLAQRVAFFYAPKVIGGLAARKAVAGDGANNLDEAIRLYDVEWRRYGPDLFMTARIRPE